MSSVVALTELLTIYQDGAAVSTANPFPVSPINVQTEFRESFEAYDTTTVWSQSVANGDIVQLDGNAASCSYLVISKDPLTAGGETTVTTQAAFTGPFETAIGLHMSQRVLGQECSIELVSTDTPLPPVADIAISSISQSTTTLTVTTATAHGLSAGTRIGIYGVTSDSRFNYPAVVVAAIVSTTSFTVTAGPGGTIASVTAGPYTNQGYVYYRPALGYAQEGISEIFENATATNASLYVRSDAGDALPSGTAGGNQTNTVGTTASVALISAAYTYAFNPTTEYKFQFQADRVHFFDYGVDGSTQSFARLDRSSVVPSIAKTYKLRFRVTNDKGLTVPTAKIVSASKAGSTTATITTATAHGLTTGDYVFITGIRNGTDFIPITTAVQVASTPSSTTFTLVYGGTSVTTTSYGGLVARAQGGNLPAGFAGAGSGASVQTATVTATELTLTSSGTFSLAAGDYVNVYGVRDNTTGADLGVDGTYKVANIATTTATLIPIGSTVLPAAFGSTACGGAVIKRTDVRISYARIFQYLRERVEVLNKSDSFSALPVIPNGGTVSTVTTVSTASLATNLLVNDITSAAITTTTTTAAITPGAGSLSQEFNVIVTATSGTGQTLDVVIQESDDSGTNWYDTYHFPRITATGQYRTPLIPLTGNRVRYVRTVAGTSPSFTMSLNRLQGHTSNPVQRQFFTRIDMNTLNTVTASFFTEGCVDLNVVVAMAAITTTAPVLAFEVSADNSAWTQVGGDITTVASTALLVQISNVQARFSRLRTKTAGSGASTNFMMVKGVGK
jgi:hypothetical protein